MVAPSKIEAWPSTWKVNDRRADHDDEVMVAQRVRELSRRGMQEACELRMPFGERAARRERADPDRGPRFLRHPHHQIDGLARDRRRGRRRGQGACSPTSAATSAFIAAGSGPSSRLTWRGLDRLRRTGPVVDRHRDEGRPAGRLHRDVIGARDRRRHVFGPRRLDAEFHIRLRKFRRALGIEKRPAAA